MIKNINWNKFEMELKNKYGATLINPSLGEENPQNWLLKDVTVPQMKNFVKDFLNKTSNYKSDLNEKILKTDKFVNLQITDFIVWINKRIFLYQPNNQLITGIDSATELMLSDFKSEFNIDGKFEFEDILIANFKNLWSYMDRYIWKDN